MKTDLNLDSAMDRQSNIESGVSSMLSASNALVFDASEVPSSLCSEKQVELAARLMSDAPKDLPYAREVVRGLSVCIKRLEGEIGAVGTIAERLSDMLNFDTSDPSHGATVLALSRRKGRHLLYALLREVGLAVQSGRTLDAGPLRTIGAWCLRRLFDEFQPSGTAIANIRKLILRTNSDSTRSWSEKAQARCLLAALRGLKQALEGNQRAAIGYGLCQSEVRQVRSLTSIQRFNHAFRRRVENLIDFSTTDAVAAAGGYGTLSASSLLVAGDELLARAMNGDNQGLLCCLEAITHLPAETAMQIPLQTREIPPEGALAWIYVGDGTYSYRLFHLDERGARPAQGTEHLYEASCSFVTIRLSPSIKGLLEVLNSRNPLACNLGDLVGPVGHHPRAAVVGKGAYRATSRRIQESIPTLLIQSGLHRWPVALATTSQFLATRGRRAYGVCRGSRIQKAANHAYQLLGWSTAGEPEVETFVGSYVTPKAASVTNALNFLCTRADLSAANESTHDQIVAKLNRHAEWLAMILALSLCLRPWHHYKLRASELITGHTAHFEDKDIHVFKGPGVPVAKMLNLVAIGWFNLCANVVARLKTLGDSPCLVLASRIEAQTIDKSSTDCIFTVDAIGRLQPVGHLVWTQALPEYIRLLPNFARHFWPLRLIDQGINQTEIDVLMRHQFDDLPLGSIYQLKSTERVLKKLRMALDSEINKLCLLVPSSFGVQE